MLAHCTGFDVIDQYDINVVTTRFFDQSGTAVEIHISLQGTDTYVRSDTGQAIVQPSHFMARIDRQAMVNISSGLQYHLMVPGLGNVLLEAGRTGVRLRDRELRLPGRPSPGRHGGHGRSLRRLRLSRRPVADLPERVVVQQTGHTSMAVLRRDIRSGSLFRENAAARVGL